MNGRAYIASFFSTGATLDWRRHVWPITALIGAILLANVIALTGLYHDDPALFLSNLATGVRHGPVPGSPDWSDPNIGYTTQALGYRAAQDWLRGVVPWWDPYQGVGAPLAAELQNGAFFLPFSLLLHFSAGWLLLRLLMQCLAGCFTYALLIQLRLSRQAALLGGVLFGCSSSFIILAHAPSYTFPFLPLLLLGIERGLASDRRFDPGWSWVIIAVAYSFYAGFPETGFLADMLGGLWFVVRLSTRPRVHRIALIGRFALAVGIGVVFTLPGLMPFYAYIHDAYIGIHAHDSATASLPLVGLSAQILPQAFGPSEAEIILPHHGAYPALQSLHRSWLSAGGWLGLLPLTLAIVGLSSRRGVLRPLHWLLLIWIVLWEARIFGFRPAVAMLDMLPPLRAILVERYAEPSVDFAVILLGAMGFDHWQRHGLTRRAMIAVAGSLGAILVVAFVIGAPAYREAIHLVPRLTGVTLAYLAMTVLACAALLYGLSQRATVPRQWLLAGLVMIDAVAGFGFSQAAGRARGHLDLSGVAYLRQHQGLHRSFSLGPLAPNYGSRYRVAQLNMTMLPMPRNWADDIRQSLDPFGDPITFMGYNNTATPSVTSMARLLRDNLPAYRSLGVRYILANPETNPLHTTQKPVFTSKVMWIYRLDHAAPYYAPTPAGACVITAQSRTRAEAHCTHKAVLLRRELFYPGWHALVNQRAVTVRPAGRLFQQITVPAGRSKIRFFFRPPFERSACIAAMIALLAWGALLLADAKRAVPP